MTGRGQPVPECYKNVAADVSRLKLPSLGRLFECSAEKNDPAHAGCYEKPELRPTRA